MGAVEHGDRAVRSFLWGLLPDNSDVLQWWARRFGVSRYRVVDLLAHVGEDCAGAVQLVRPERATELQGTATSADEKSSVTWLSEKELETRLRDLRMNPAAGRAANDAGQFSLAGAQPKTALYQNAAGRWGIPTGRMPTNRILKPPTIGLGDFAWNEHLCLALAREVGLPAAASSVETFGGEIAVVVERYDRAAIGTALVRVHQEDMCQALGVPPTRKYESHGGPGIAEIAELLRTHSTEPVTDVNRFVDSIALNWLIAGTDVHAKNYSVLHAAGPQLRLAPLYDLVTVLPYPQLARKGNRLAMAIGGERLVREIDASHWNSLARTVGVERAGVLARVERLATEIPSALDRLQSRGTPGKESEEILTHFGGQIAAHCRLCLKRL